MFRKSQPLLRCLALYRFMPWRFSLTALLFIVVNGSLAWQQWLIGRAVHDVERGVAVVRLPSGVLDYTVAQYWLLVLLAVALVRGMLQYAAGMLSLIVGQDLLFILRERILVQVQRLDLIYHWRHGIGELVTRTTRDADKVRDALINLLGDRGVTLSGGQRQRLCLARALLAKASILGLDDATCPAPAPPTGN